MGKTVSGMTPDALALLSNYDWPGNVRELQHAVERAVILSNESVISAHAFDSQRFGLSAASGGPSPARLSADYGLFAVAPNGVSATPPEGSLTLLSLNVADAEGALIARALEQAAGNRTKAAELLGISVRTLRNKLNTPGSVVSQP